MIQWGGEGRPESLSSLWDAFVGNKDNGEQVSLILLTSLQDLMHV